MHWLLDNNVRVFRAPGTAILFVNIRAVETVLESEFWSRSLRIFPGVGVGVGVEFFSTTPTPDYLPFLTFVNFAVS